MSNSTIFAWTEPTPADGYPGYLNISRDESGRHTVTVRSRDNGGRDVATIVVTPQLLESLLGDLSADLYRDDQVRANDKVSQHSNERIAQECEQAFQRGGPRVYVVEKGRRIVPTLLSARRAALNISDDEAVWARRKVGGRYQWRCIVTQPGR